MKQCDTVTWLQFFGLRIKITSSPEVASWLSHDYGRYLAKNGDGEDSHIAHFCLKEEDPSFQSLPPLTATLYHDDYIVYDNGLVRVMDFFGSALVMYDTREKLLTFFCNDTSRLYEVFYTFFESWLTEELGNNGYHSVHCLALAYKGRATLVLLPPGGGKTTLALRFLNHPEIKVLGEDVVLYKDGVLYGFHNRWGTRAFTDYPSRLMVRDKHTNKHLIDSRLLNLETSAQPEKVVLGLRLLNGQGKVKKGKWIKTGQVLFKNMVLGLELQQSLALFLLRNFSDVWSKLMLGSGRLAAYYRILCSSQVYTMELGRSIDESYINLEKLIIEDRCDC